MDKLPSVQEQNAYNDCWNATYRSGHFEEIDPEARARGEKILEILASLPVRQPSILEAGCGTGWLTEKLVSFGPTTAIDLSPGAIEIAKRRGLDAEFIEGDFYKTEFSPGQFDIGVCNEVISTVPDQPRFIAKLASSIKPRGYLILTSQNKFIYKRRHDVGPPKPGNIRKWLSRGELRKLLGREFRVLQMRTIRPKEGRGLILRIAQSRKLNWLATRLFKQATIDSIKESFGLGQTWVILAKRRDR